MLYDPAQIRSTRQSMTLEKNKKIGPPGSDFLFDANYLIPGLNQIVSLKVFPRSIESNPPL
jgi:hypothetical protein